MKRAFLPWLTLMKILHINHCSLAKILKYELILNGNSSEHYLHCIADFCNHLSQK